jgi:hypothetical protein
MINRIEGTGPVRTPPAVRKTSKVSSSGGASFSKHLEETEGTGAAQGTGAMGSVMGVFGIQEVDDALAHASKGKLRAQDILDRLEELRIGILAGALNKDKLEHLSKVVNERRQEVTDSKLKEILDEIDLRAQVELAKFHGTESDV